MRIDYICHACLLVDTGDAKLLMDPWFQGAAYCGQWNLFPKPVNADLVNTADVVLFSHGHEDHFHDYSVRALPRSAKVFYPYSWYGGTKPYLEELGFREVVEAEAQKTYHLTPDTAVTYLVNNLDSIVIVESRGKVFVNVNDALHSYPPKIQDIFIDALKKRWPHIDTVFCGFGGASYFPNTLHCPGKNDLEIGQTREQLFAHNFCRIVHALSPDVAVPFAADFALLGPGQRWINDVRFPRARMADYFRELYPEDADSFRIFPMYSGDILDDNHLLANSPYRSRMATQGLRHLIDEQYAPEIAALASESWISEADAQSLESEILANVQRRKSLYGPDVLGRLEFSVKVRDCRQKPYFNVSLKSGAPSVSRSDTRSPGAVLVVELASPILRYSLASDWGGDAITIGYGCEIEVFDPETIRTSLDVACVKMLTRHPSARRHWKVEPLRMAHHLISSPTTRAWVTRAAFNRSSDYDDKKTNDVMREWLFRSKCEVCRACDLPLLDEKFANSL